MRFSLIHTLAASAMLLLVTPARGTGREADGDMDKFVSSLMAKMTLQEKIGQLNLCGAGDIDTGPIAQTDIASRISKGEVGGVLNLMGADRVRKLQKYAVEDSPHGIPLIFGLDVIHGYRTMFPIPLGISSTWNLPAIEESARIAAAEAGSDGICWTFSPMVDICRDPRWGRQSEGSGEDPFLGSEIAKAMVRGYQGDNTFSEPGRIMACVKHLALYGAPDGGRDYNTVDMSRNRMFNEYLPPYRAAVDAGVGSAMSSFNTVDGIPATGNRWVLTDLLRGLWGFDGFTVSDAGSIHEMRAHGMGDMRDVAVLALKAGLDMDLGSEAYTGELANALAEGRVTEADIDLACRRILEAKYRLGLFKDPYRFCDASKAKKTIYSPAHREAARALAAESFVLLKNEGGLLPLRPEGKIALIGPILESPEEIMGTWAWCGDPKLYTPILDVFRKRLGGKAEVIYARGAEFVDSVPRSAVDNYLFGRGDRVPFRPTTEADYAEAVDAANRADVVVAFLGEHMLSSGESSSRVSLELPESHRELLRRLLATGKPVVLVNFSGRAVVLDWENANVPAILQAWSPGSEAGDALYDVIFGEVNPSGRLTVSFPRSVGQLPMHYDELPTGRPGPADRFQKFTTGYTDSPNAPLFPFGYGLSYTTFDYSPVRLSAAEMNPGGSIEATVTVTNTGKRDGYETVQLYLRDPVASVSRPVKQLKGFRKIHLKAGESRDVTFRIEPEMLKFYNSALEYVCEPGEFIVMTGPDSDRLSAASFTLKP